MRFIGVVDKEFQALVEAAHAEMLPKLLEMNNAFVKNGLVHQMLERLVIDLSPRLRTRAGVARTLMDLNSGEIQLNYRLLKKNPQEIRSTYLHELAHVVANLSYRRCMGHSKGWQRIAIALGDDGGRCHKMDVSEFRQKRKPAKRYAFHCECREWMLTKGRVNKHLEYKAKYGRNPYSCPSCKKGLEVAPEALTQVIENVAQAA